jgi:transcriptional regulator with XRE-family HTH domain
MSTTGQRIRGLRDYNNMALEDLSSQSGMAFDYLVSLERDQKTPTLQDAKDLSFFLGVDTDYIRGCEKKRYMGYAHILSSFEETLVAKDAWIETMIDSEYDLFNYEAVLYNTQDPECDAPMGSILYLDTKDSEGLYIVDDQMIAHKKDGVYMHQNQVITPKKACHIAFITKDIKEIYDELTRRLRDGTLDL